MYVCMYECMYVCMYACLHVLMYVCMNVCMCNSEHHILKGAFIPSRKGYFAGTILRKMLSCSSEFTAMNPAPYIGPLFRLNAACTALTTLQRLKDIHSFIFQTLFSLRQNAQLGMHLSVGGGKHANETLFLRA